MIQIRKKYASLPPIQGTKKKKRINTQGQGSYKKSSCNIHQKVKKNRYLTNIYLSQKDLVTQKSNSPYYIPQQIDGITSNAKISNKNLFYERMYNKKLSYIINSLSLQRQQKNHQEKDEQTDVAYPGRYDSIIQSYQQFKIKKKPRSQQDIRQFLRNLNRINSFFNKLDFIVSISFFQLGKILTLQKNRYLYHQDDPLDSLFIILWGQLKLKTKHQKKVKYLMPGDSLGEQFIFQSNKSPLNLDNISLEKKIKMRSESAKTVTKCGVLQLSEISYYKIQKSLSEVGFKDQFYLAQKMMTWGYSKKKKFYT